MAGAGRAGGGCVCADPAPAPGSLAVTAGGDGKERWNAAAARVTASLSSDPPPACQSRHLRELVLFFLSNSDPDWDLQLFKKFG